MWTGRNLTLTAFCGCCAIALIVMGFSDQQWNLPTFGTALRHVSIQVPPDHENAHKATQGLTLPSLFSIQDAREFRDAIRSGGVQPLVADMSTQAVVRQLRLDSDRGDLIAALRLEAAAVDCISSVYVSADALGRISGEHAKGACWAAFGDDVRSDRDLEELRVGLIGKLIDAGMTESLVDYCVLARQYLEDHRLLDKPTAASSDIQARATQYLLDAANRGAKSAATALADAYSSGWLGVKDAQLAAKFAQLAKTL